MNCSPTCCIWRQTRTWETASTLMTTKWTTQTWWKTTGSWTDINRYVDLCSCIKHRRSYFVSGDYLRPFFIRRSCFRMLCMSMLRYFWTVFSSLEKTPPYLLVSVNGPRRFPSVWCCVSLRDAVGSRRCRNSCRLLRLIFPNRCTSEEAQCLVSK